MAPVEAGQNHKLPYIHTCTELNVDFCLYLISFSLSVYCCCCCCCFFFFILFFFCFHSRRVFVIPIIGEWNRGSIDNWWHFHTCFCYYYSVCELNVAFALSSFRSAFSPSLKHLIHRCALRYKFCVRFSVDMACKCIASIWVVYIDASECLVFRPLSPSVVAYSLIFQCKSIAISIRSRTTSSLTIHLTMQLTLCIYAIYRVWMAPPDPDATYK